MAWRSPSCGQRRSNGRHRFSEKGHGLFRDTFLLILECSYLHYSAFRQEECFFAGLPIMENKEIIIYHKISKFGLGKAKISIAI